MPHFCACPKLVFQCHMSWSFLYLVSSVKRRDDSLFCWYWWNWWPFYKYIFALWWEGLNIHSQCSTNINKASNNLSPPTIEHKEKDHGIWHLKCWSLLWTGINMWWGLKWLIGSLSSLANNLISNNNTDDI